MLHTEVALVDHEVDQASIDRRRRVCVLARQIGGLDGGSLRFVPDRFLGQLLVHELAGDPRQSTEDRSTQVEVVHTFHLHLAGVVERPALGDGSFALKIQRRLQFGSTGVGLCAHVHPVRSVADNLIDASRRRRRHRSPDPLPERRDSRRLR